MESQPSQVRKKREIKVSSKGIYSTTDETPLSSEELMLKSILEKHDLVKAPWKTIRAPGSYEFFVALGVDEVAQIVISSVGLERLGIDRTKTKE